MAQLPLALLNYKANNSQKLLHQQYVLQLLEV
jgi:hypothetical protein